MRRCPFCWEGVLGLYVADPRAVPQVVRCGACEGTGYAGQFLVLALASDARHVTDGSPCWCRPEVIEGDVVLHRAAR